MTPGIRSFQQAILPFFARIQERRESLLLLFKNNLKNDESHKKFTIQPIFLLKLCRKRSFVRKTGLFQVGNEMDLQS